MEASCMPFYRIVNRAVALTLIVGLPQWALAVQDPFAGLPTLKDEQLDELRGGFESIQGFQFSFAIERAVVINGELVTSTRLVLNDLSPLLSGGTPTVQLITSARNIVQNGFGNAISPAPAATPAPPSPAASTASTTTMPAVSNAPGSAAAPAIATVPSPPSSPGTPAVSVAPSPVAATAPTMGLGAPAVAAPPPAAAATGTSTSVPAVNATNTVEPLVVQMNAGGQTIVIPNANAIVMGVQNTVNNQIIQTRTTIDAALNSLSALRANTLANTIRQQALDAVRRP